jgi:hypothetical protein
MTTRRRRAKKRVKQLNTFTLSAGETEALEAIATQQGLSRSTMVGQLIRAEAERRGIKVK